MKRFQEEVPLHRDQCRSLSRGQLSQLEELGGECEPHRQLKFTPRLAGTVRQVVRVFDDESWHRGRAEGLEQRHGELGICGLRAERAPHFLAMGLLEEVALVI